MYRKLKTKDICISEFSFCYLWLFLYTLSRIINISEQLWDEDAGSGHFVFFFRLYCLWVRKQMYQQMWLHGWTVYTSNNQPRRELPHHQ